MSRIITEVKIFDKIDLEDMAKGAAKAIIIADIYFGDILDQKVEWTADGSLMVFTNHEPKRSHDAKSK